MKAIPAENFLVRPFLTHKTQTFSYTYFGGSNPAQVSIDLAVIPPTGSTWQFTSTSEPTNPTGIFQRTLYPSVMNLMYRSGSVFNMGYLFTPTDNQFYVISLAQQSYGEKVHPTTFVLSAGASTASLVDDGKGNIVSSVNTGSVVGSINYSLGLVVLRQFTGSYSASIVTDSGVYFTTGSQVSVTFDATHTIYEYQVICTMEPGEFNYSTNPSVAALSSSVSGTVKILDGFASGTLTPYITTIGIYSSRGELVAVGKLPRPIKRATDSQQSIILRWDV